MVKVFITQLSMFGRKVRLFCCGINPSDRLQPQNSSPFFILYTEIYRQKSHFIFVCQYWLSIKSVLFQNCNDIELKINMSNSNLCGIAMELLPVKCCSFVLAVLLGYICAPNSTAWSHNIYSNGYYQSDSDESCSKIPYAFQSWMDFHISSANANGHSCPHRK